MKKGVYLGIGIVLVISLWLNFQPATEDKTAEYAEEIHEKIEQVGKEYGLKIEFGGPEMLTEGDYLEFDTVEEFEQFLKGDGSVGVEEVSGAALFIPEYKFQEYLRW